jgi:hypothetical protein
MTELQDVDVETVHVVASENGCSMLHLQADCHYLEKAADTDDTNYRPGEKTKPVDAATRRDDDDICQWCAYRHAETTLPPHTERERYHDRAWLAGQYHEKNQTAAEIADACDCSEWTICKWIHKHDIKVRYQSEHWLRARYHGDGMSLREIADECDIGKDWVGHWMREHDIERRGKQAADPRLRDAEWLRQQYHDRQLSLNDIGEECDCDHSIISRWMDRHDIQTRSQGRRGGAE